MSDEEKTAEKTAEELAQEKLEAESDGLEPYTYQLKYPVEIGTPDAPKTLSELVFQPVCARHIMAVDRPQSDGARYTIEIAAQLCGLTLSQINKVKGVDVTRMMTLTNAFFLGTPVRGGKLSE